MPQNIFDATLDPNNDVKVNNFDWSHANNLTTQIGRITPIFCDMVPAKTSFRVNPRFGLQFMPMVFPIQTRMKARISFFRYPLRALWKDYKDFIGNFREGLEEPYLNFNTMTRLKKMASTGSLGDYLGLPTTLLGDYGNDYNAQFVLQSSDEGSTGYSFTNIINSKTPYNLSVSESNLDPIFRGKDLNEITSPLPMGASSTVSNPNVFNYITTGKLPSTVSWKTNPDGSPRRYEFSVSFSNSADLDKFKIGVSTSCVVALVRDGVIVNVFEDTPASTSTQLVYEYTASEPNVPYVFNEVLFIFKSLTAWETFSPSTSLSSSGQIYKLNAVPKFASIPGASATVQELNLSTSPWYNSSSANKDKQQKILAYGFRAYEGVYNAFFRDNRNNPYYLNGQVQYNKWIPNDEGGVDNELYELRYANWEKDFLTTAVQSPQQGNAPLVGITTYTQTIANEDGTNTELIKTALVDEDGKKYGLSFKSSNEGLEGVEYIELDNGTNVRQARSLYDLATSGISIPDLRMVNCYQKFLELNMRKGYSYKDIIEGRFAVKVRYADLLLPEFFGGVSRDIDVNSVTQTVDQNVQGQTGDYDKALGSQSGLAGVRGSANANIECFCDEESIILGVLVVTPLPVYTQLLPKHFTYRGLMEHYQPEFNLIGFQPIKYNEVCPIQSYNSNPSSLTETFGYNRPWYEFAQKYDVAHGLFRTDLSNFLMHRVFNQKPELAQSFLLVDPEQVTDVFAVTETTDKIYGQIWFDITCKLPIARVAIPRLD